MTRIPYKAKQRAYERERAEYRKANDLPPGRFDDRPPPGELDDTDEENG